MSVMNLSELFREARQYGCVYIFTCDSDGTYSCDITFHTIANTKLKAKSGYGHKTPEEAVRAAILVAEKIVDSMAQQPSFCDRVQKLLGNKN